MITGVILAGGRGDRMNGADKGLLMLRGRPLAAHVLAALAPQVSRVLISANRNADRYAALGAPVIADPFAEAIGPLGGILAGLEHAGSPWALFAPCDMPQLPADLARQLIDAAQAAGVGAAYACSGGDAHYTCCLLRCALAPALRSALADGTHAVRDFLAQCSAVAVPLTGALRNLNTPQALAAAQAA